MSINETLETEVVPETQALTVRPSQAMGLFGSDQPLQIIHKATDVATALKAVIVKQGLVSNIQGKQYPKCEAWTLLGTMLGVFPVLCWSKPIEGGWEARVEARTKDGAIVGAAEAQCLKSERNWSNRDDFALRSMAQTRATAKCLRMPLGFVMTLAGYEPTPAEEMVSDHPQKPDKVGPGFYAPGGPVRSDTPKQSAGPKLKPPTEAYRKTMIERLDKIGLYIAATDYFQKLTDPTPLMPGEAVGSIRLPFVPNSQEEMENLIDKIQHFANGDPAEWAFKPHWDAEDAHPPKPASESLPKLPTANPEWWREIIVPVPPKGSKRADYMVNPDTLGTLFDKRHGNDEEAQAARQRLWGFVNHYEAKPWVGKDGKQRPPSDTDVKFREALDALAQWFEENHRGEKL